MQIKKIRQIIVLAMLLSNTSCRTAHNNVDATAKNATPEIFQTAVLTKEDLFKLNLSAADQNYQIMKDKAANSSATPEDLFRLIRAARLANKSTTELNSNAQRLMSLRSDPKALPWINVAILELVRDAISQQKLDLASYYLSRIAGEKDFQIQSEALTASGIISYLRNDFDSAIKQWTDAIRIHNGNKAARINLGFLLLRTGNSKAVRKTLEPIKDHWLALSGLIVVYRLSNQVALAQEACSTLKSLRASYSTASVNCSLFFAQNKGDKLNAMTLLEQVIKSTGRPEISEYAFLLKNELAREGSQTELPRDVKGSVE